jgi:hypothetical protein
VKAWRRRLIILDVHVVEDPGQKKAPTALPQAGLFKDSPEAMPGRE